MPKSSNANIDPQDTIKILVATDIHLGFDHSKQRGCFWCNISAYINQDVIVMH